jgi:hypothetical protein
MTWMRKRRLYGSCAEDEPIKEQALFVFDRDGEVNSREDCSGRGPDEL